MNEVIKKTVSAVEFRKPKALEVMAGRLNVDPAKLLDTLKATVFKNASNEELLALVVVANEYDLSPFLKEIYAFPAKGGGICPVVSVDGWNKMLIRQEGFDGIEFEMVDSEDGMPHSCTATIYMKGRSRPVKITEYFSECYRKTDPWDKMPRRMLRHKALIQGARVAFGFSGVHDADEAVDIQATIVREPPPKLVQIRGEPEQAGQRQERTVEAAPAAVEQPASSERTPQQELESACSTVAFDDFRDYSKVQFNQDLSTFSTWDELPRTFCETALKEKRLLEKCVKTFGKKEAV